MQRGRAGPPAQGRAPHAPLPKRECPRVTPHALRGGGGAAQLRGRGLRRGCAARVRFDMGSLHMHVPKALWDGAFPGLTHSPSSERFPVLPSEMAINHIYGQPLGRPPTGSDVLGGVFAQRAHSAGTAPIITVIIQVTTLKTTHLRNHGKINSTLKN